MPRATLDPSFRPGFDPGPPTPRDALERRVPPHHHPRPHSRDFGNPYPASESQSSEAKLRAIATLLHHYRDVLDGIPDQITPRGDELLALMCPAWNHPSYQQLERLLRVLHQRWPRHRQALRSRYERYTERRVASCQVCKRTEHVSNVGKPHLLRGTGKDRIFCRLGSKRPDMVPKLIRVLPPDDDPALVDESIAWLHRYWQGRADLPKSVFEIEAEARLRAA